MAAMEGRNRSVAVVLSLLLCSCLSYGAMGQCSVAERQALLDFKANFIDYRADLATWSADSKDSCCGWKGVLCSRSGVGAVEIELADPTHGQTLTINPNDAYASVKAGEALAKLNQMVIFHSTNVAWNGPFPFAQLSKLFLREIVIRNGHIGNRGSNGGSLPNEISLFTNLEILVISGTHINIGLPSGLCKLSKLIKFEFSQSELTTIGPACLGSLPALEEVRMNSNFKATGGLPVWPTSLRSLKVLDLSFNAHSGNIPVQYGKLGNVQLFLAGNKLANRIPAGLSGKPVTAFRPGNPKLCGAPLPSCQA